MCAAGHPDYVYRKVRIDGKRVETKYDSCPCSCRRALGLYERAAVKYLMPAFILHACLAPGT